ncbi:hypothetical protein D3C71_1278010 [compost metagenome]
MAPAQVQGNLAFGHAGLAGFGLNGQHQLGFQNLQAPTPEHRQRAVRRHAADGFVVFKVVAELGDLGVVLVLGLDLLAAQQPLGPQPFAQVLHQCRVFGPAFGKDVAHAVQHCGHGRKVRARLAIVQHLGRLGEGGSLHGRVQRGVGKELVSQRLDAELAGHLALGAALLLERQVDVFQLLLRWSCGNGSTQRIGQLALLVNALEHRSAAVVQLAQVRQAGFQLAQLDIVQPTGDFLAVARDKGHRGAPVQQLHRCAHLLFTNPDFCGQLPDDLLHVWANSLRLGQTNEQKREAREFATGTWGRTGAIARMVVPGRHSKSLGLTAMQRNAFWPAPIARAADKAHSVKAP